MHASSLSNTRAGPSCTSERSPAILIRAPSGARLPLSTTTPPVGEIGSAGERITAPSGRGGARTGLFERRAAGGERRAVKVAACDQRFGDHRHAADGVHILRMIFAAGPQIADQRRALEHCRDVVEREADAGFVRDRRNMQRGVGRAAGRGDDGAGILQARARDEIARQRATVLQNAA